MVTEFGKKPLLTWCDDRPLRSVPGALLVSLLDGTLVALDPLTGAELWTEPFDSGKPLIRSVPAAAPGAAAPGGDAGVKPSVGALAAVFPGLDGALYAYADGADAGGGGGGGGGKPQKRGLQVCSRTASLVCFCPCTRWVHQTVVEMCGYSMMHKRAPAAPLMKKL